MGGWAGRSGGGDGWVVIGTPLLHEKLAPVSKMYAPPRFVDGPSTSPAAVIAAGDCEGGVGPCGAGGGADGSGAGGGVVLAASDEGGGSADTPPPVEPPAAPAAATGTAAAMVA